ncbi:MAG: carboxylate--amine ligase, partial [Sphingobium sp.]
MTRLAGAIVLGLDSAIGLTIMRELGQHGVPVHGVGRSTSGAAAASRYCTTAFERPEGPIAAWLPELIARTGAGAVFATSETDLLELAGLPPRIGDCHLLVPRMDPLQKVLDKNRTLAAAAEAGLLVPHSWQPLAGEDFADRVAALRYPVVAKWANPPEAMRRLAAHGLEWIKADYILSAGELARRLERYRPVGCWPLIQEYCGGWGLGQMLHMEDGRATLRFQHRRLHEWPPEGGVSTLCRAEPPERHAAQMALSEKLLRALDWQGPAMVEYRHDGTHYWLMEVN